MDKNKVNALCLNCIDFKDNDKLLTLLTVEKGKIIVKARGVNKPNAKLKFASFPFCFGNYIINETNGFFTLIGCDLVDSFFSLSANIENYYGGMVILETLDKLIIQNEVKDIVVFAVNCLKEICYNGVSALNVIIFFLLKIFNYLGIEMQLENCANCGKPLGKNVTFYANKGGFVGDCCFSQTDFISPQIVASIRLIKNLQMENLQNFKGNKDVLLDILNIFYEFMSNNLSININSLKEFKQVV
ncbi:MAG: DNA repair protein RecO [Clostridia bacterium]